MRKARTAGVEGTGRALAAWAHKAYRAGASSTGAQGRQCKFRGRRVVASSVGVRGEQRGTHMGHLASPEPLRVLRGAGVLGWQWAHRPGQYAQAKQVLALACKRAGAHQRLFRGCGHASVAPIKLTLGLFVVQATPLLPPILQGAAHAPASHAGAGCCAGTSLPPPIPQGAAHAPTTHAGAGCCACHTRQPAAGSGSSAPCPCVRSRWCRWCAGPVVVVVGS